MRARRWRSPVPRASWLLFTARAYHSPTLEPHSMRASAAPAARVWLLCIARALSLSSSHPCARRARLCACLPPSPLPLSLALPRASEIPERARYYG